jgi:hypothetical protein
MSQIQQAFHFILPANAHEAGYVLASSTFCFLAFALGHRAGYRRGIIRAGQTVHEVVSKYS